MKVYNIKYQCPMERYMSDFRFYGRELSAQEISDYYHSYIAEYPNY